MQIRIGGALKVGPVRRCLEDLKAYWTKKAG
jgi:hypothetical protein